MTLIEKCIATWPEIEWEELAHKHIPGTWVKGVCSCGATVTLKKDSQAVFPVHINWHGGLSFHETLVDAKVAYQKHARKVMESAGFVHGYTANKIDTVTDATEGRR